MLYQHREREEVRGKAGDHHGLLLPVGRRRREERLGQYGKYWDL